MTDQSYLKWTSQLRKGYLELCVMVTLQARQSSYGFELLQLFHQSGLDINEGTLYPMLNRLFKNGWLKSHWETPKDGGHPRRFYQLSKLGQTLLPEMLKMQASNHQSLKNLKGL